jgi:prevent-host-death family protein
MTTQTISMSDARANFAETLDAATKGDVILVTRRGKPDAALVDAEILEDYLASTNPRIIKKVQTARKEVELISFEDAFKTIA